MENYDDYSFCTALLIPGEIILWRGKPGKGHLIQKSNIGHLLINLFSVVFICFWCFFVIKFEAPKPMILFGIFGFVIAQINLFRYPAQVWYQRRHSSYVLTNCKLIRKIGKKVDILELRDLPRSYTYFNRDGSGTISFGHQTETNYYGFNRNVKSSVGLFRLENIPNAVAVYRMIMEYATVATEGEK